MAWTAPRTWTAGEIVTASIMNSAVRDNLRYLKGLDGVPTIESGLTIDNTDGDERLLLPLLSTAECTSVLDAEGEVAFDEQTHRIKIYDNDGVESLVSTADVDDTPANGATTDPVSSNWAYDHVNDADQHPEYQKESLLTTQGDMTYATGASTWARLAKGTANQFLRMNAGATAPEWAAGALVSKLQTHTRDMDGASGDVGYTGYGFQPAAILIMAEGTAGEVSIGFGDDDLAEMCLKKDTAPSWQPDTAKIVYLDQQAGNSQAAVLKTLDADGFTLTWTLAGNPTNGNADLIVLALG